MYFDRRWQGCPILFLILIERMREKSAKQLNLAGRSAWRRFEEEISSSGAIAMALVFFAALTSRCSWAQPMKPRASISGSQVIVTTSNGMNQVISMNHVMRSTDVVFEDLTFSGRYDLRVMDRQGAFQIFYRVYLFSPASGSYVCNERLSAIPCLVVDRKKKQIVGACFHASACENWEERYAISAKGSLSLLERTGTYCDSNGRAYQYTDYFRSGKRASSEVRRIQR